LTAVLGVLLAFASIHDAPAAWAVVQTASEKTALAEHRTIDLDNNGAKATLHLALFSPATATLRLIDNPTGANDLASALQQRNGVGGVNGGYFDPQFAPIGLRVIDGLTTSRLTRARLLTGVLFAAGKRIDVVRLPEFARIRHAEAAVECGPFLVEHGAAVRGLDDTRPARRTFAALLDEGKPALGVCSDVTLAELAAILPRAKATHALNLDGGSSSAFWFRRADGSVFEIGAQKAVRDFIAVVPR
jgi:uncharacterized protein YigE (DUF2233 family)